VLPYESYVRAADHVDGAFRQCGKFGGKGFGSGHKTVCAPDLRAREKEFEIRGWCHSIRGNIGEAGPVRLNGIVSRRRWYRPCKKIIMRRLP
jgi:hypothetical protein